MQTSYKKWKIALDIDDLTLGEVYESLPKHSQESISLWVRLLENPKSPFHLRGAVGLLEHDCIHLLLSRGLLPQDEAFVIGFTMGSVKNLKNYEILLFEWAARFIYPAKYRLSKSNLVSFRLGIKAAKEAPGLGNLVDYSYQQNFNKTIGSIREELNINKENLRQTYLIEADLLPDTTESHRLRALSATSAKKPKSQH